MNTLTVLLCKIAGRLLGLIGRGSALPGRIALKINPDIWAFLRPGPTTIYITGTTGKTSISGSLTSLLSQAGYLVANNSKGSNIDVGILTALLMNAQLNGQIKPEIMILEVDERHFKRAVKYFPGNYLLINNLSRDQSARNGHFDIVWQDIKDHIPSDIHLVLNADDIMSHKFSLGHEGPVSYYGLAALAGDNELATSALGNKTSDTISHGLTIDNIHCPVCHSLLAFDVFYYGNIGRYTCPKCDFGRPDPDFLAEIIDNDHIRVINQAHQADENTGQHTNAEIGLGTRPAIKLANSALYTVYNTTATYALASLIGLADEVIISGLNQVSLKVKRLETFAVKGKQVTAMLSKNETPISYNQSLDFIRQAPGTKAVMIGFDVVDDRQDLKDLSWLWDIDFSKINDPSVTKVIAIGNFAYDLALALEYASIDEAIIETYLDSDQLLQAIENQEEVRIYALLYFDLDSKFRRLIGGR